jgi:copper chaperone CopZ
MKIILISILLLSSGSALAADQTVTINVGNMTCGADPHNIKNSLASLLGVKAVKMSLPDKTATVTFDADTASVDALLVAIASAGYAGLVLPK